MFRSFPSESNQGRRHDRRAHRSRPFPADRWMFDRAQDAAASRRAAVPPASAKDRRASECSRLSARASSLRSTAGRDGHRRRDLSDRRGCPACRPTNTRRAPTSCFEVVRLLDLIPQRPVSRRTTPASVLRSAMPMAVSPIERGLGRELARIDAPAQERIVRRDRNLGIGHGHAEQIPWMYQRDIPDRDFADNHERSIAIKPEAAAVLVFHTEIIARRSWALMPPPFHGDAFGALRGTTSWQWARRQRNLRGGPSGTSATTSTGSGLANIRSGRRGASLGSRILCHV